MIRFKLLDASGHVPSPILSARSSPSTITEKATMSRLESAPATLHAHSGSSPEYHRAGLASPLPFVQASQTELLQIFQSISDTFAQFSSGRVAVHQVQPFFCFARGTPDDAAGPPVRLLSACHTLSATMAVVGFILALLGILTFAWTALPVGIGAFASACLGTCLLSIFATICFC